MLAGFHRKIAKHMVSAPAALLYMPKGSFGLGFESVSDMVELHKWGLVAKGLRSPGKNEMAMQSNLERGLSAMKERVGAGVQVILPVPVHERGLELKMVWISGLLLWANRGGLRLCRGGVPAARREASIRGVFAFGMLREG